MHTFMGVDLMKHNGTYFQIDMHSLIAVNDSVPGTECYMIIFRGLSAKRANAIFTNGHHGTDRPQ